VVLKVFACCVSSSCWSFRSLRVIPFFSQQSIMLYAQGQMKEHRTIMTSMNESSHSFISVNSFCFSFILLLHSCSPFLAASYLRCSRALSVFLFHASNSGLCTFSQFPCYFSFLSAHFKWSDNGTTTTKSNSKKRTRQADQFIKKPETERAREK